MARNNEERNIALNFITNAENTKKEIDNLKNSIDSTSDEFKDLEQQSASLDSAIVDLNNALNNSTGSSNILQTSINKLEGELERVNNSVKKLNTSSTQNINNTNKQTSATKDLTKEVTSNGGAMAILDTVTGGWASTTRDGIEALGLFTTGTTISTIAQKAYTVVVGTSTGALKAFRIALAATGIGLAVVAVIALVQAYQSLTGATDEATEAQKRLNAEMANSQYEETLSRMEYLASVRREQAREQGASIETIRDLEREVANERLEELDRRRKDERLTSEQIKKAGEEYLNQQRYINLQEARWRADDAESIRKFNEDNLKRRKETNKKIVESEEDKNKKILQSRRELDRLTTGIVEKELEMLSDPALMLDRLYEEQVRTLQRNQREERQALNDLLKEGTLDREGYNRSLDIANKYYREQIDLLNKRNEKQKESIEILSLEEALLEMGGSDVSRLNDYQDYRQAVIALSDAIEDSRVKERFDAIFNVEKIKESYEAFKLFEDEVITLNTALKGLESLTNIQDLINDSEYNKLVIEKQESIMLSLAETEAEKNEILNHFNNLRIENYNATVERQKQIDDEELRRFREREAERLDIVSASAQSQMALIDAGLEFASEADRERIKSNAGYKTAMIGLTIIDTYASAMSAYKGMVAAIPGPWGIAAGIAAAAGSVATGLTNVKRIASVKLEGSSGSAPSMSSAGATPNVSFVSSSENQIANSVTGAMNNSNQEPIKAYVVSGDVSSSQALERNKIESNSL